MLENWLKELEEAGRWEEAKWVEDVMLEEYRKCDRAQMKGFFQGVGFVYGGILTGAFLMGIIYLIAS